MKAKGKKASKHKTVARTSVTDNAPAAIARPEAPVSSTNGAAEASNPAPQPTPHAIDARAAEVDALEEAHEAAAPPAASERRPVISGEARREMIALRAFERAKRLGFQTNPVEDWLIAEREVDNLLMQVAI